MTEPARTRAKAPSSVWVPPYSHVGKLATRVLDPRARAVALGILAMKTPALAGRNRDRLADVERQRAHLLQNDDRFDDGKDWSVAKTTRRVSKPPQWCRFLHALTARHQPAAVVEMGTGVGVSGAAIATALPAASTMTTIDIREASSRHARTVFAAVGVDVDVVTGAFDEVLEPVLAQAAPVDLLFVDGHHNRDATLRYTDMAIQFLSDRAIVVYDDIRWSDGMLDAWEVLEQQQRWSWTHDLGAVGLCAS